MRVSLVFTGRDLTDPAVYPGDPHNPAPPWPDGPMRLFNETLIEAGTGVVRVGDGLRINYMHLGQFVGVVVDHLDTEREVPLHGS